MNTKDFDWERLVVIPAARQHGRLTQQMIEFYAACKKGEKVVFRMLEGDICSPEYAKVVINEAIKADRQQLLKAVEEMRRNPQRDTDNLTPPILRIALEQLDEQDNAYNEALDQVIDLLKAKDYIKEFDNQIPREGL